MASRRDVVTFLTAPARSGKSFNEVRRLCDEMLPQEKGHVYTNLPLFREKIAEYVRDKHGLPVEETLGRLHVIPREIEQRWRDAGTPIYDKATGMVVGMHELTGPWDYFRQHPLAESTIIIDEIHNRPVLIPCKEDAIRL